VRYEGNVYEGCLQQYDFDHDIALVHVMMCLHVNAMYFGDVESPPYSKVVAVGRDISGKLMATSGILAIQVDLKIVKILCYLLVKFLRYTSYILRVLQSVSVTTMCILEAVTLVAYHFILFLVVE
jgi:hypothetical protein